MDDVRARLLEMLVSGKGTGDLREMVAQQANSNPQLQALLQMMARREAPAGEEAVDASPPDPDHTRRRRAERLREKLDDMREELEELRERNELCAAALGACFACWGTDEDCPECAGRGRTGWRVPDRELFQRMVVPAVRRWREKAGPSVGARREAEER